jgi:hypothetical protein
MAAGLVEVPLSPESRVERAKGALEWRVEAHQTEEESRVDWTLRAQNYLAWR